MEAEMSTREKFVEKFGEEQAKRVYDAAVEHKNGLHDREGSDPFRWAIAICIGFECLSEERYRKSHGITVPWEDIKRWIIEEGDLKNHDGDVDYLALCVGGYNEFVPEGDQDDLPRQEK
jgi:hypothetical protein